MSTSMRNDLLFVENNSNQAFADSEVGRAIEETALLVSKFGLCIERCIKEDHVNNEVYSFLMSSDHPYHAFYQQKLAEYQNAKNQLDNAQPDPPLEPRNSLLFTCPEGITLKEFDIIKLTAMFVVRYGMYFWQDLLQSSVTMNPQFEFIKTTDRSFSLFLKLADVYERVFYPYSTLLLKETGLEGFFKLLQGKEEGVEDLHAFVGGLDYFASREAGELSPPPPHLSTKLQSAMPSRDPPPQLSDLPRLYPRKDPLTYPEGITPKQLGIIKLTAQFFLRYGIGFLRGLTKRVIIDPRFEFLNSTGNRYRRFYNRLVSQYGKLLFRSQEPMKRGYCTETIVEGFFNLLQGENQEGAVHASVGVIDYFANSEDDYLTGMPVPPPPLVPGSYGQMPLPSMLGMSPEEPEPKRRKIDESAFVTQDQFLAQVGFLFQTSKMGKSLGPRCSRYQKTWQV